MPSRAKLQSIRESGEMVWWSDPPVSRVRSSPSARASLHLAVRPTIIPNNIKRLITFPASFVFSPFLPLPIGKTSKFAFFN
jgi:hypothetical protein